MAASLGALSAVAPDFQPALDVPNGGVLCALPALLAVGLLDSAKRFFTLPKGYYGLDTLFLLRDHGAGAVEHPRIPAP